jgi:RNA polymerase sigma factor (sigma-70 family)
MIRATVDPTAEAAPATAPAPAAPDEDLVRRVLAGQREAYSVLVRRHQEEMFRYARGIGLDYDAAQDTVQEAFVVAYTRLRRCREPRRFRQWLMRIVRNRCLDYHRDIRRKTVPLAAADGQAGPVQDGLASRDLRRLLDEAFDRLSPPLRDSFLLRFHGGYSYEEMAELTGKSVSAMKMRVQRTRRELQRYLDGAYTGSM